MVRCEDDVCSTVHRSAVGHGPMCNLHAGAGPQCRKLIELGAANTELLQGKELRAHAMAGSWSGSTDEQAAMVLLMNEHHIQPVMPDGSGYNISWACNPHRPASSTAAETAACAQRFLETRKREKSAQPAKLR